jgi:hypothetical protein
MLKKVRTARRRTVRAIELATRLALVVGAVGAMSGCTSNRDAAPAAPTDGKPESPSRALVLWADTMCATTASLEGTRQDSAEKIEKLLRPDRPTTDPAYRQEPGFAAQSYLNWASSSLDSVARGYAGLRPSGIPAADRLRTALAASVNGIRPEVTKLSDFFALTRLDAGDKVERARRVGVLVASLKRPRPDLPAVADKNPDLAAAYHLAPHCVPAKPPTRPVLPSGSPKPSDEAATTAPLAKLPPAADGTDFAACKDGKCQVRLTPKPADIEVGDLKLTASVRNATVRLYTAYPSGGSGSMTLGEGGKGSYGRAGGNMVTVTVKALRADEANVDIATSRP